MSENPIKQVLGDLLPYFESLEAQSSAILQLLRDKQIANDEELNRYLEQAGDASSVKWRAARVRMEHLFATSPDFTLERKKTTEEGKKVEPSKDKSGAQQDANQANKQGTAVKAESADQPTSSQQADRYSEKAPEMIPSQKRPEAIADGESAAKPETSDSEKTEPRNKSEADAA